MTKNLIGYKWNLFQKTDSNSYFDLPERPSVYVILVRYSKFKRAIIAYIGQTKCMRKRIPCHVVFQTLQRCQKGNNYQIEILYKDFGVDNEKMEQLLLNNHKPPFDGIVNGYSASKRYDRYLFWKKIGVKRVITSKHDWAKDKHTVSVYLKKYKRIMDSKSKFSRYHKGY